MRVALAGLGGAATHGHLPALRLLEDEGRLRLVAAADHAPESRRLAGATLGDIPLFANVSAMLAAVQADLLVIATEPSSHAELIELGFSHDLHVLCEKPLAHAEGGHSIVQTAVQGSRGGIISFHQYRYARTWAYLAPWIRRANALRLSFSIVAEVCRESSEDAHSASPWRANSAGSRGLLIDHAAHFIALAWAIDPKLRVLAADRARTGLGRERSWARIGVGSGVLELHASSGSPRRTRLGVLGPGLALDWQGSRAEILLTGWRVARWRAGALSDRGYLDSLYVPLYRDLLRNLNDEEWRTRRTAESLAVASVLVELFEWLAD